MDINERHTALIIWMLRQNETRSVAEMLGRVYVPFRRRRWTGDFRHVPRRTFQRDLSILERRGIVRRIGRGRATRYIVSDTVRWEVVEQLYTLRNQQKAWREFEGLGIKPRFPLDSLDKIVGWILARARARERRPVVPRSMGPVLY